MSFINILSVDIPWGTLKNIGAFLLVLGILVFIHELGHYATAKFNKMHVYQFCLGLGPKILKYKGKETTYAICALPIGGMVDLREDENDPENLRSFSAKKPWQRLMVILAGGIMNFILALVIIVILFVQSGSPSNENVIGQAPEGYPASEYGLAVGDEIIEINGQPINKWTDITDTIVQDEISTFDIKFIRLGQEQNITLEAMKSQDGLYRIGISQTLKRDFFKDVKYGFEVFVETFKNMIKGFGMLVTGQLGSEDISGPVGIYNMVGEVADTNSFSNLMSFTAILSINLGILNLLPFPFLDGGRAIFILFEMVRGKPFNKDKEAFVHFIGMVVLMLLMIVLVFKDLRI